MEEDGGLVMAAAKRYHASLQERSRQLEAEVAEKEKQLARLEAKRLRLEAALRERQDRQPADATSGQRQTSVGRKVKLDVGGHHFATSLTTLTSEPDSMLAAMFSGRHALDEDEDGRVFIDRDPKAFAVILDWLRNGHLPARFIKGSTCGSKDEEEGRREIPTMGVEREALMLEATYYGLTRLVSQLQAAESEEKGRRRKMMMTRTNLTNVPMRMSGEAIGAPRSPRSADDVAAEDDHDEEEDDDGEGFIRIREDQLVRMLNQGHPLQLSGCDLRGYCLSGMNLSEARFVQCNFRGVDLRWALLNSARLVECDLRDTNLFGAQLVSTNLYSSNLRRANLMGANLQGANLNFVDLRGAMLAKANLKDAKNLSSTKYQGVDWKTVDNLPRDFKPS